MSQFNTYEPVRSSNRDLARINFYALSANGDKVCIERWFFDTVEEWKKMIKRIDKLFTFDIDD